MKLLDVLAEHPDPVPLKQLALETGLHSSTAHRILGAMTSSGFVERSDAGVYRLGIRLLELGSLVKSRISLRETAMSAMLKLHAATGESVNLGIRAGDEIVYIERTSSGKSAVRVVHIVGARAPLHTTATGKLFLVEDGPQKIKDYARRTGLPASTAAALARQTLIGAGRLLQADTADVAELRRQLGSACRGHDVLFSTASRKKTGLRL